MAQRNIILANFRTGRNVNQVSGLALALAGAAFFSAALPVPAWAGFEWTPPVKPAAAPAAQSDNALLPEMPALPRDSVEMIDMSAQPVATAPAPTSPLLQPAPQIPSSPFVAAPETVSSVADTSYGGAPQLSPRLSGQNVAVQNVAGQRLIGKHESAQSAVKMDRMPSMTAPSSSSPYEQAVGFGTDIPLALAMRQIVPPQYGYVFSGPVDQGARIDWNGGKPWNEVLADAVRPQGLDIDVTGQTVRVFPQGQNPAPVPVRTQPDLSSPMLTGAESGKEPMREVYVRRHSSSGPVATERMAGEPAETTLNTPVVLTAEPAKKSQGKSGFWSHFGLDSSETTTIRNEEKIVSQQGAATPRAPAMMPQQAPTDAAPQLIAEMHDSQIYESEINAPMSLTSIPAERVSQAGNPYTMDYWQAEQGDSLRRVLEGWSNNAGVELRWTAPSDYTLPAPVRLQGSYTDALSQVLGSYDETAPRPVGRLHPNLPAGPSVLVIEPSNS